jgi:hypothetical protein
VSNVPATILRALERMPYHESMSRPVLPASPGLFAEPEALKPLAERMRPSSIDEIVGQQRLVGPDKALRRALEAGKIHSMATPTPTFARFLPCCPVCLTCARRWPRPR